ncbi:MAG TPA: GntR family transcriptional regulator [Dehalococcoidia bacterium]|nr:GntR family transcriptional regulator [Dehalococcoidia bacterium]
MRVAHVAAPIRTQVVETLRTAITSGRFAAGQRLVEKELCALMEVSRASLREALRQLEAEGLVVNVPNRGLVVARLTVRDAESIYEVRGVLEALAARLFASRATDEQVAALGTAVGRLGAAYAAGDVERIIAIKKEFYDILFAGSGNSVIPSILRSVNARITQLRRVSLSSPARWPASIAEIRAMLAAIERRDPEAAFHAALDHVQRAAAAALPLLEP